MPLGKAGEEQVGSRPCRRQGILEQAERDVYGETTEDKAGDGPGCVVHNEAWGGGWPGREEEKDQSCPTSGSAWRSGSSDHNGPAEGTSTTSETSQPEDRGGRAQGCKHLL